MLELKRRRPQLGGISTEVYGPYARFSFRVQRKVCLVVHGQNGSAVRKHEGHAFAASRVVRHVLNQAISKIGRSGGAPFTRTKGQDRAEEGAQGASGDSDSPLV
jgi:hypothetical protein